MMPRMTTRRRRRTKSTRRKPRSTKRAAAKHRTAVKRRTAIKRRTAAERRTVARTKKGKAARLRAALRADPTMTLAERRRIERLLPAIRRIAGR
jgi:hypothetical protein